VLSNPALRIAKPLCVISEMESNKKIKIINSWILTGFGIIAEVKNLHGGLPKGTVLKSIESGVTWIVESRIIETFAMDKLTRFQNETEIPFRVNIKNPSGLQNFRERVIERDKKNIFQYHLMPKNYNEKPKKGEELLIE